jgi:hypothetical protein
VNRIRCRVVFESPALCVFPQTPFFIHPSAGLYPSNDLQTTLVAIWISPAHRRIRRMIPTNFTIALHVPPPNSPRTPRCASPTRTSPNSTPAEMDRDDDRPSPRPDPKRGSKSQIDNDLVHPNINRILASETSETSAHSSVHSFIALLRSMLISRLCDSGERRRMALARFGL